MTDQKASSSQVARIKMLAGISQGDVLLVNLAGAKRQELAGNHPCVVVSNAVHNQNGNLVIVVPLTTHGGKGVARKHEVQLEAGEGGLEKRGAAVPHQVCTIDRHADGRVIAVRGKLSDETMDRILDALLNTFDDDLA